MTPGFLVRRLLQVVPIALGIVFLCFLMIHFAPGDPVVALAGENGDATYYAFMRQRFGLDRPLIEQLVIYFGRVARGDLGHSYVLGRSTLSVIAERVPATLLLTGTSLLIAVAVAVPIGAAVARRPLRATDVSVNAFALALQSTPTFWMGQLAILFFALTLGALPVEGMQSAGTRAGGVAGILDILRHLLLPATVLALQEVAIMLRVTRRGVIDELSRDHIRTARAKGLSEFTVIARHAMPRAMLPVITVVGSRSGQILAGAAVVEVVFGWPGMGRLLLSSLQTRDTPVLLGLFLVVSLSVVFLNVLTDVAYAAVDPRVRIR